MRILPVITILAMAAVYYSCGGNKITVHEVKKEHRIMDEADLLTSQQEDSIFTIIQDLEKNIGSQIAVLTVVSLNGEKIEERSLQTAEKMGLGRAKYDDGILVMVAVDDRQMRIEVGYGLEKIIKDEIAARINREVMAPRFSKGDYFNGIKEGVEKIKNLIEENGHLVGERP